MNRPTGILLGIGAAIAFVVFLFYSSLGDKYRVEVCVTFRGAQKCKTARAKTREEAIRTASENACAEISSGMTDTMACQQSIVSTRDVK